MDGTVRPIIAATSGLTTDGARLARQRNVTVWDETILQKLESAAL